MKENIIESKENIIESKENIMEQKEVENLFRDINDFVISMEEKYNSDRPIAEDMMYACIYHLTQFGADKEIISELTEAICNHIELNKITVKH